MSCNSCNNSLKDNNGLKWKPLNENAIVSIRNTINRYRNLEMESLAVTCTGTSKMVGNVVYLTVKPTGGIAPYTVTFYKDGAILNQIANVIEAQTVVYNYMTVAADVSTTAHIFSVTTTDSCPVASTGPKSSTESCNVTISAAIPAPITSVIVRTKISETATSEVVAFKRFYGAGSNLPNTVITVDGATVMTVLRYPNADGEIQLTLTKRSAAYNICADTVCISYITGAPPIACNIPTCTLIVT